MTKFVAVEAEKVPAPAKGVAFPKERVEPLAWAQLPVSVRVPVTVVIPPV